MPKILTTPETIVEQQAIVVNRKDIIFYSVDVPADSADIVVSCRILARNMDAVTGLPTDGLVIDTPKLTGNAALTAMASAGAHVILGGLTALGIAADVIASVADALAKRPSVGGLAYYDGTKAAIYEAI